MTNTNLDRRSGETVLTHQIFELYMTVEPDDKGGLGYISKSGELAVTLELEPPVTAKLEQLRLGAASAPPAASGSSPPPDSSSGASGRKAKRTGRATRTSRKGKEAKDKAPRSEAVSLELLVHQDPSGLHSRSGETGTVLWRSSLALAENTLRTLLFEPPGWLDWNDVSVLELGAGVGMLAMTLGAVAQQWTATDYLNENLRLVKRNCAENADVRTEIAHLVGKHTAPAQAEWDDDDGKGKKGRRRERHAAHEAVEMPTLTQLDWTHVSAQREKGKAVVPKADLVLAVDCLYNEHLVRPFVDTLAAACSDGAIAFIVVELRSSDVVSTLPLLSPLVILIVFLSPLDRLVPLHRLATVHLLICPLVLVASLPSSGSDARVSGQGTTSHICGAVREQAYVSGVHMLGVT